MMTVLNPLALLGLFAAAIPILLHLFTLRRLRVVEFSSLRFLKELQRSTVRRIRLRQWLLLLLRTLFVILLVLAFARPTVRGAFGLSGSTQAATTAVILFDDTPSMGMPSANGVLLEQARAEARRILDLLKEDDDVLLLPFSAVRPDAGDPAAHSRAQALRQIADASAGTRSVSVEDAIRAAARTLSSSRNFNREIYLLSDLQRDRILSTPPAARENLFDARTRCFVFPLSAPNARNISVQDVRITDAIREIGRPLDVRVALANHGSAAVRDHVASVFLEGERVAQRGVEIAGGGRCEIDFQITPRRTGFLSGTIELEDDDGTFDNRLAFTVFIPEELNLLLVGTPADVYYLRLAFETRVSDSSRPITIAASSFADLPSAIRPSTDVVVAANPAELSPHSRQSLKQHLERGGGVLLFPGQQTTVESYRSSFQSMGFPAMTAVERTTSLQRDADASTDRFDRNHPVFLTMFEDARKGPRSTEARAEILLPQIRSFVRWQPSVTATPIISRQNGIPYLVDSQVLNGRVILFSVAATNDWSDLPSHGSFVPLVRRSAAFAAQQRMDRDPMLVGEQRILPIEGAAVPMLQVVDPAGAEASAVVGHSPAGEFIRLPSTMIPGVYTIRSNSRIVEMVRIIPDRRESDPTPDLARLEQFLDNAGIPSSQRVVIDDAADLHRAVTEARFGTELWSWFAILALAVAVCELFVARESRRALEQLEINRYI